MFPVHHYSLLNLGKIEGTGRDGRGILDVSFNLDKELVITYTDGTKRNLGKIAGLNGTNGKDGIDGIDGTDGRGISAVEINAAGELIITYTDETTANLGKVVGSDGTDGINGIDGINGTDGKGIKSIVISGVTEHDFDEGREIVSSTCTRNAVTLYICKTCGITKAEEVLTEGHNYVGDTCTVCGGKITDSEGLEFELSEDGLSYSVKGIGTCTDMAVGIPSAHNGLPVTAISDIAFAGKKFEYVFIPETVTDIGERAFQGCSELKCVTIPENVESIGGLAFLSCRNLKSVNFLGDKITEIKMATFQNCPSLAEIDLPESVSVIRKMAFQTIGITAIRLPSGLKEIEVLA